VSTDHRGAASDSANKFDISPVKLRWFLLIIEQEGLDC
jgi:hypothetical protein